MQDREPTLLRVDNGTPGRSLRSTELIVGDTVEQHYTFEAQATRAFDEIANDKAPVHQDVGFAKSRGFRGPILQGLCVSTRFSRLIGMYLPGENAVLESLSLKFRQPTYEGETLVFRAKVVRILNPLSVVKLALTACLGDEVRIEGEAQCLIK